MSHPHCIATYPYIQLIGEMEDLEVEGGVVSFIREGSELEGLLVSSSSSSRRRILILLGIHRYNSQKNSRSVVLPLNQNRSKKQQNNPTRPPPRGQGEERAARKFEREI
jgi:hypothetical protein